MQLPWRPVLVCGLGFVAVDDGRPRVTKQAGGAFLRLAWSPAAPHLAWWPPSAGDGSRAAGCRMGWVVPLRWVVWLPRLWCWQGMLSGRPGWVVGRGFEPCRLRSVAGGLVVGRGSIQARARPPPG